MSTNRGWHHRCHCHIGPIVWLRRNSVNSALVDGCECHFQLSGSWTSLDMRPLTSVQIAPQGQLLGAGFLGLRVCKPRRVTLMGSASVVFKQCKNSRRGFLHATGFLLASAGASFIKIASLTDDNGNAFQCRQSRKCTGSRVKTIEMSCCSTRTLPVSPSVNRSGYPHASFSECRIVNLGPSG